MVCPSPRLGQALGLLALVAPLANCAPNPQGGAPPFQPPSVQNLTLWGTGCPIGGAAIIQQTRNNTPVFVLNEWALSLPDPEGGSNEAAAKWCNQEMSLRNGPTGMRLRIANVVVGGWAQLEAGTTVALSVTTRLGDIDGGVSA